MKTKWATTTNLATSGMGDSFSRGLGIGESGSCFMSLAEGGGLSTENDRRPFALVADTGGEGKSDDEDREWA